jgi:trigger factor
MDIEVVSENAYARKVNVKVPAANVRAALDKAVSDVMKRARIPGFRPGKVPRQVVEQRFGASIAQDVAGDLVQKGWRAAIDQHKLEPVSQPSVVEQGEVAPNADFTFVIGVEVKPSVTASVYTGLEVYWPKWEISDEEVDRALERERQGQSRLTAVTDRPVQAGDSVQVQLVAKDGETVVLDEPGTQVQTLGESWLAGLEPFLVGLSIDEEKSGEVTFSDKARNPDVKGRTLAVTAKVLGIQTLQAPELSDALAKEAGHDSLDAWKSAIRARLQGGREEAAKNQARANLLEKLIEANTFDVPQGMIEHNLRLLVDELRMQQIYAGRDPKDFRLGQNQVADLRRRAQFAARAGLLLEAVWNAETIEATDADVEARLKELADERGQTVEAVRGWFQGDEAWDDFRGRIREEKTLDWLLDNAKISHEAPVDEAAGEGRADAAPAVEPEPKPKKAPAKKAKKAEAEEAPEAEAPAEEAPAKPKKAPAKKKAAEEPAADAAPAEEPAPKPKRAAKKKADAE